MTRTAVLGAGALGLTVAYRLAQRGDDVVLIEREPLPGGLAAGFEIEPGMWLDKFYHHLFRGDHHAIGLIEELGLGDDLLWPRPADGHAAGRPESTSWTRRPRCSGSIPLPVMDRLRMGAWLAYLKVLPGPDRLEGQTAADWIRRRMGGTGYDVVWGPLLRGKFGALADEIAMPWFWARVHDRTAELGYLRGGFQRLYNRLAERLTELGADAAIRHRSARGHDRCGRGRPDGDTRGRPAIPVDRVVSTLAVRLTCRLVPELPDDYRSRYEWGTGLWRALPGAGARPAADESYWMNVNDPGFPFMALVEHTNYMDPADYGGRRLVYLGNYRPMDDPLLRAPTDEVVAEFAPAPGAHQPGLRPSLDHRGLVIRGAVRAADRHRRLPPPHPAIRDAGARPVGGEHVPGLPA